MSTIRVTLIEDHDLTRIGIRAALQQQPGIEVIGEASNGETGLQLLQSQPPDVAIIDVGLPDMTGVELTQRFKAAHPPGEESATKILIMTMQDSEETVLAAFAAGADSYCMKDIRTDRLVEALQLTAEGSSWIDPAIARIVLQQTQKNYATAHPHTEP